MAVGRSVWEVVKGIFIAVGKLLYLTGKLVICLFLLVLQLVLAVFHAVLWSSIFVTLMANKIGGLQFGIYRNCQISSRVFHTAVAALPLTKANRSDFE